MMATARSARLGFLEQMQLLEELDADASEDELSTKMAARSSTVKALRPDRPSRKPFTEYLPRERVVVAAPTSYPGCSSVKLVKLVKDISKTLEVVHARGR